MKMHKMPTVARLRRLLNSTLVLSCVWGGWAGCSGEEHPPAGFGVIREHLVYAPHNVPPIRSQLDYTIIRVDGAAVVREKVPPLVDMQPGVLLKAGVHTITARVQPHLLPRGGYEPTEITFSDSVKEGKIYYLVDQDKKPVLIEMHVGAH